MTIPAIYDIIALSRKVIDRETYYRQTDELICYDVINRLLQLRNNPELEDNDKIQNIGTH